MADQIIKLKIDCSKIDKSKLFKGKNGAQYLDATLLYNTEVDQYGNNGMIVQDVSKEDRAAGKKGAILGNGKALQSSQPAPAPLKPTVSAATIAEDDLPF